MKKVIRHTLFSLTIAGMVFFTIASVFMYIKMQERTSYMNALIKVSISNHQCLTRDDTVRALSQAIYNLTNNDHGVELSKLDWYERFESTFFFNMTSTVALKYGGYGVRGHYVFGPCGTMSRTLLNALWVLDIPARKLQLLNNDQGKGGGHTMVEYEDNGKWKVIAPSDNAFVWRNEKGEIASVEEIRSNPAIFQQVYTDNPSFPYLFDNPKHLNWTKVPEWIQTIVKSLLGEERFNALETPVLYDHPRHLIFYLCLTGLSLSLFSFMWQRYRHPLAATIIASLPSTLRKLIGIIRKNVPISQTTL